MTLKLRLLFLLSAPLLAVAEPAQAGFWEDLFGIQEKPAAAPQPARPDPALAAKRAQQARAAHEKSIANEIAVNKALKAAQSGKDPAMLALQDSTLRRGDIVSGPNGLMVYMGGDPENPGEARFVPANDPKLERSLRESLKGLKRPAVAAAPEAAKPSPQAREVAQDVSVERDGKVIRVIGTYQVGAQ
ncbi:hypothetical protein GJ654_17360 [Rhodoblastus acidophilus]|uniref:Type IV pilus biogenesis protein PilP n=1 Tax=Rhodoblastus acidophilus TaxID=1074 RepID=A0A6N8DU93_RHOAC|nr:hypothetical protein [Rhodoblastus acidophilus]